MSGKKPEVYTVGCLGKIINFNETSDRRFIINLSGIIRFKIQKELISNKLYREFNVDYSDFIADLEEKKNELKNFANSQLFKKIKIFFHRLNYAIEFDELLKLLKNPASLVDFIFQHSSNTLVLHNADDKIIQLSIRYDPFFD